MEQRNLEKAVDIYARLMMGEEIRRDGGANRTLYEDYTSNPEVYEIVNMITGRLNLQLYEYNNSLFLTAGDGNRVFGYSNEELKRLMGLRYNKELYLVYFIMYQVLLCFYTDTGSYQFVECVQLSEVLERVTKHLRKITAELSVLVQDEVEENSFKAIALLWDELPLSNVEETDVVRAARNSRMGMTKLTLNFMIEQKLLLEAQEHYYPTDRLRALSENYFEEYRGRLYEILKEEA
ncbi:MAG: hypothetical protein J6D02_05910 [Lachnospira sp.]|nr:hypothetical protein [Lachnospira sp.]